MWYSSTQTQDEYYATKALLDAAYPSGGSYFRQMVWVANPATTLGRSPLIWNNTAWVPPAGAIIANQWRGASSIIQVTPGAGAVGVVTLIYASPVIPDCFLLANSKYQFFGASGNYNASGVANAMQALIISGTTPTMAYAGSYNYPLVFVGAGNTNIVGISASTIQTISLNNARTAFKHASGSELERMGVGTWNTGANKVLFMAQPSSANDQIQLDGYQLTAIGNL